jgi:hypothetical protein
MKNPYRKEQQVTGRSMCFLRADIALQMESNSPGTQSALDGAHCPKTTQPLVLYLYAQCYAIMAV